MCVVAKGAENLTQNIISSCVDGALLDVFYQSSSRPTELELEPIVKWLHKIKIKYNVQSEHQLRVLSPHC